MKLKVMDTVNPFQFEYVEYGKLKNTSLGIPDWNSMLYTEDMRSAGQPLAAYLSILDSFRGSLGKFSFALIPSNNRSLDEFLFVAIQQRNESEISHGGREYHHMRFTRIPRRELSSQFENNRMLYSTLAEIFKDNMSPDGYRFPERIENQKIDANVSEPDKAGILPVQYVTEALTFSWIQQTEWISRLAFWLSILVRNKPLTLVYGAELTLSQRLIICETLQILLQALQPGFILTYALDNFTSLKTQLRFITEKDRLNIESYSYRDTVPNIISEKIESAIYSFFVNINNMKCPSVGAKLLERAVKIRPLEMALLRWRAASAILLDETSTDELVCFYSFKGQYEREDLCVALEELQSQLGKDWITLFSLVFNDIQSWLSPTSNNHIAEIIIFFLKTEFVSNQEDLVLKLLELYWNALKSRPKYLYAYLRILEHLPSFSSVLELLDENLPYDADSDGFENLGLKLDDAWKMGIASIFLTPQRHYYRTLIDKPSSSWYSSFLGGLKQQPKDQQSNLTGTMPDDEFVSYIDKLEVDRLVNLHSGMLMRIRKLADGKYKIRSQIIFHASETLNAREEKLSPLTLPIVRQLKKDFKNFSKDQIFQHLVIVELPLIGSQDAEQADSLLNELVNKNKYQLDGEKNRNQTFAKLLHGDISDFSKALDEFYQLKVNPEAKSYFRSWIVGYYLRVLKKGVPSHEIKNINNRHAYLPFIYELVQSGEQRIQELDVAITILEVHPQDTELSNKLLQPFTPIEVFTALRGNTLLNGVLKEYATKQKDWHSYFDKLLPEDWEYLFDSHTNPKDIKQYIRQPKAISRLLERGLLNTEKLEELTAYPEAYALLITKSDKNIRDKYLSEWLGVYSTVRGGLKTLLSYFDEYQISLLKEIYPHSDDSSKYFIVELAIKNVKKQIEKPNVNPIAINLILQHIEHNQQDIETLIDSQSAYLILSFWATKENINESLLEALYTQLNSSSDASQKKDFKRKLYEKSKNNSYQTARWLKSSLESDSQAFDYADFTFVFNFVSHFKWIGVIAFILIVILLLIIRWFG